MGIAIIISNNIDFKIKAIKKDKEGQCIIIKGSIQGEDTTLVNFSLSVFVLHIKMLLCWVHKY